MLEFGDLSRFRRLTLAILIVFLIGNADQTYAAETGFLPRCAQPQPIEDRTYLVFFSQHSDRISLRGKAIINEFMNSLKLFADVRIHVEAHNDTSEVSPSDRNLSLRRGNAVENVMRQIGLPPSSTVTVDAVGAEHLLVPTPPLTNEPQNRNATFFTLGGRQVFPNAIQSECLAWLRTHECGVNADDAQRILCSKVQGVVGPFKP